MTGGTTGGFAGGTTGELGVSACAGVIDTTWINGTVHAAVAPTTAPRFNICRRLRPGRSDAAACLPSKSIATVPPMDT